MEALAHKSLTKGELRDIMWYELLKLLPYSSDLVPSNLYLFLNLKKFVVGKCLEPNEMMILESIPQRNLELKVDHTKNFLFWIKTEFYT